MGGGKGSSLDEIRGGGAGPPARAVNRSITLGLASALISGVIAPASAQAPTPNPGTWRPLGYANLQKPFARDATYVDIWKDAIDANSAAYLARSDRRFSAGPAPATEAHFVIWGPKRAVVVSILDTALGCSEKGHATGARAVVKLCPMRVAVYDGLQVHTLDAGRGCFLEPAPGVSLDPSAAASYGAYDVAARVVKIGVIVDGRAIDGCSFNIPLDRK